MDSLSGGRVADVLQRLFIEAEEADRPLMQRLMSSPQALERAVADIIAAESADLRRLYHQQAGNFLGVSPAFGRFLYICARACKAKRIVEFGTSMGLSAIHLAAALRDMGGGELIGTELEATKARRARENLGDAGLADLVEIREGDARDTLRALDGDVDMVLLDGAFTLYLQVLKLLEPRLKPGALVIAENAFEHADGYLSYVRNPANGYRSQSIPVNGGRGNEVTVVTGSFAPASGQR